MEGAFAAAAEAVVVAVLVEVRCCLRIHPPIDQGTLLLKPLLAWCYFKCKNWNLKGGMGISYGLDIFVILKRV